MVCFPIQNPEYSRGFTGRTNILSRFWVLWTRRDIIQYPWFIVKKNPKALALLLGWFFKKSPDDYFSYLKTIHWVPRGNVCANWNTTSRSHFHSLQNFEKVHHPFRFPTAPPSATYHSILFSQKLPHLIWSWDSFKEINKLSLANVLILQINGIDLILRKKFLLSVH